MPENFFESSAYAYGMIQGIKLLLQKMAERVNTSPMMYRGSLRSELELLISQVNEFPTINEKGKFFIETFEGMPVFRWHIEAKNEIVEKIIGE